MGCGSCSGAGCGKAGGCSSGSCNRMNTYDWLADIPVSEFDKTFPLVEISFNQGSRKDFYYNPDLDLEKGELVVVEGVGGVDMGEISLTGEIVKLQIKKKGAKVKADTAPKVLRLPSEEDIKRFRESKAREKQTLIKSRRLIENWGIGLRGSEGEDT